eukprot:2178072-Pyramimonas_sp.AAC.1
MWLSPALASAPRTYVLQLSSDFTGAGRAVFKMWLSPQRHAHSSYNFVTISKMAGGSCSNESTLASAPRMFAPIECS